MNVLGLDIGSSSVKAAVLRSGKIAGGIVRERFPTRYDGVRAEVEPDEILKAVAGAIRSIGDGARRVEVIGISVMSPAWVAMDGRGKALTPIVTPLRGSL